MTSDMQPRCYGTGYFVSLAAACRYYRPYGCNTADVKRKLNEGAIRIGKPPVPVGGRLFVIDNGNRYAIREGTK